MTVSWKRSLYVAIPIILIGLLYSSIDLAGPAWHLAHRGSVRYREWRIPVPFSYFVVHTSNGPSLRRLSLRYPWVGVRYASIYFLVLPSGRPLQSPAEYERFAEATAHAAPGYRFVSGRKVRTGNGLAYCFEFASLKSRAERRVGCAIAGSALSPFYVGSSKYLHDFFSVLKGMSTGPAGPSARN